jgi:hypothetical protein
MKDLGVLHWFLGTQFKCSDGVIGMNQTRYIQKQPRSQGFHEDEARHEKALVWAGQFCILIG